MRKNKVIGKAYGHENICIGNRVVCIYDYSKKKERKKERKRRKKWKKLE